MNKNSIVNDTEILDLARKSAMRCGQEILACMNEMDVQFKGFSTNPVTDADKAAESITKKILQDARPDDGLLGEEGTNKESQSGLRWVFDPLDGTVNYMYTVPHWCFSISCEEFDGVVWAPRVGLVYDVLRKEVFTAIQGSGAFLNDQPIHVNDTNDLSKSLIATEFSYDTEKRASQARVFSDVLVKSRDIRSCGSSALDLCWVACGRWDGFYEEELKSWDWSAGSLIVQEAKGIITPLGTGVIASAPGINDTLQKFVKINRYSK